MATDKGGLNGSSQPKGNCELLREILTVNPDNVPKVVSKNSEPLYGFTPGDTAAIQARLNELRTLAQSWENFSTNPELLAQARARAATDATSETPATAPANTAAPAAAPETTGPVGGELFNTGDHFNLSGENAPAPRPPANPADATEPMFPNEETLSFPPTTLDKRNAATRDAAPPPSAPPPATPPPPPANETEAQRKLREGKARRRILAEKLAKSIGVTLKTRREEADGLSAQVEAEDGNWEPLENPDVKVPTLSVEKWGGSRNALINHLKATAIGVYKNKQAGFDVRVNNKTILESDYNSRTLEALEVMQAIPEIISEMSLFERNVSKNAETKEGQKTSHVFYAPVSIGGLPRIARIVVHETTSRNSEQKYRHAYNLNSVTIKNATQQREGVFGTTHLGERHSSLVGLLGSSAMTNADLANLVKIYFKKTGKKFSSVLRQEFREETQKKLEEPILRTRPEEIELETDLRDAGLADKNYTKVFKKENLPTAIELASEIVSTFPDANNVSGLADVIKGNFDAFREYSWALAFGMQVSSDFDDKGTFADAYAALDGRTKPSELLAAARAKEKAKNDEPGEPPVAPPKKDEWPNLPKDIPKVNFKEGDAVFVSGQTGRWFVHKITARGVEVYPTDSAVGSRVVFEVGHGDIITENEKDAPPPPTPPPSAPSKLPRFEMPGWNKNRQEFVNRVAAWFVAPENVGKKMDNRILASLGKGSLEGDENAKVRQEMAEVALNFLAREIATAGANNPAETYRQLVSLYERQPLLNVRDSNSKSNQAYSTPAPLAYVVARLAGTRGANFVVEPTAGNGMLLLDTQPDEQRVFANELDGERKSSLRQQFPDAHLSDYDATTPDYAQTLIEEIRGNTYAQEADGANVAIVMNPPFGTVLDEKGDTKTFEVKEPRRGETLFTTTKIDHAVVMNVLNAAQTRRGKTVLIIGSPGGRAWEKAATGNAAALDAVQKNYLAGANQQFFGDLYRLTNVVDHFTVAGDLYSRQGAAWPVDVILIEGTEKNAVGARPARKSPAAVAPEYISDWSQLESRVEGAVVNAPATDEDTDDTGDTADSEHIGDVTEMVEPPAGEGSGGATAAESAQGIGPIGRIGPISPIAGATPAANAAKPAAAKSAKAPATTSAPPAPPPTEPRNSPHDGTIEKDSPGHPPTSAPSLIKDAAEDAAAQNQAEKQSDASLVLNETGVQAVYTPSSRAPSATDALTPKNLVAPVKTSLERVRERRGDLDDFVRTELGYETNEDLFAALDASQIDAVALALDNVKRAGGGALINGDMTDANSQLADVEKSLAVSKKMIFVSSVRVALLRF